MQCYYYTALIFIFSGFFLLVLLTSGINIASIYKTQTRMHTRTQEMFTAKCEPPMRPLFNLMMLGKATESTSKISHYQKQVAFFNTSPSSSIMEKTYPMSSSMSLTIWMQMVQLSFSV